MLETFKNIFSIKDLRKKIIFTIFIILLYRLGTFITVPGMDKITLLDQMGADTGIMSTINIISGGAFGRFSIFAMTIGPYITASIILNLLQMVIPSLEKLAKEGEEGKKTLSKYTKYLTITFAVVEALGLYLSYKKFLIPAFSSGIEAVLGCILVVGCLVAGTAILMWLGDKITEYGVGNGISMIIFVSIVSRNTWWSCCIRKFCKWWIYKYFNSSSFSNFYVISTCRSYIYATS
ncbi:MAG: hypothetical protein RSE41_01490 [Clostridia bacterium]